MHNQIFHSKKNLLAGASVIFLLALYITNQLPFTTFNNDNYVSAATTSVVRGVTGDLWADYIIGKPNFNEVGPFATDQSRYFVPSGVYVDRSVTPNRLYVYDSGNNRILGYSNLQECISRTTNPLDCTPDLILGQPAAHPTDPGFGTTSTCNGDSAFQNYPNRNPASASSLCTMLEETISLIEGGSGASMVTDSQGNFYVTDFWNHRILKYNSPFTTDAVADDVWGQNDFTGNTCNKGQANPDATTLCFAFANGWAAGVDIDAAGNLWVNDSGNHRILRFPPGSHTADYVLGQTSFTTKINGSALNQLNYPGPVRVGPDGNVYVADTSNNRVVVYNPPFDSTTFGKAGTLLGTDLSFPMGIDFEPTNPGKVWITNNGHSTVELWDPTTNQKIKELGWRNNGNVLGRVNGSIGFDSTGNAYAANRLGDYHSSVIVFEPSVSLIQPTKKIVQSSLYGNLPTASTLNSAKGTVISDGQLIIADTGRVLFWNDPAAALAGQPASGSILGTFSSLFNGCCFTIKADKNHHLWVTSAREADYPNRIQLFTLPLTSAAQPVKTITLPLPILGGGTLTSFDNVFWGVQPTDNSEFLWASQAGASRVFRIRDPLSNNPVVDVILGQLNGTDVQCNRGGAPVTGATDSTLCLPTALSFDNSNNLYVSDNLTEAGGNRRLLVFNNSLFPTSNPSVIYAPSASKVFSSVAVWGPAFESNGAMIVGFDPWYWGNPRGGRFVGVYNNPNSLTSLANPDMYFNDFSSTAFSLTVDNEHNVYIGDLNRGRVHVYKNPLNIGAVTPTSAASPTPTPTIPVVSPTPTPTKVPNPTATNTPIPTVIPSPTPTTNAGPITFSNITSFNILSAQASISWKTSQPGTTQVVYGTSSSNLNLKTAENMTLVINHTVTITNLKSNTRYYYKVFSRNSAGIGYTSQVNNFKTKGR